MRSSTQPVILFLEDDQDTRELVQLTLALAGIRVHSVTMRSEAWNVAVENWFDLFLLDGKLPDGDSFQLCADLCEFAPEKPVVFYSALAFPKDMQRAFDAGASAFFKKPFMGDLGAEITELLQTGKRTEPKVQENIRWVEDSVQIIEPSNSFARSVGAGKDHSDNVLCFTKM